MIVKMSDIRNAKVYQTAGVNGMAYVVIYKGEQRIVILLDR